MGSRYRIEKRGHKVARSNDPYKWHNNGVTDATVHILRNHMHAMRAIETPRERSEKLEIN
ncbi:hypothetical protein RSAG8_08618, partial [Rhizoctonia solani AG-8 WAC10335]